MKFYEIGHFCVLKNSVSFLLIEIGISILIFKKVQIWLSKEKINFLNLQFFKKNFFDLIL